MEERPNILFINTDQQRGDCLGVEGHPVLETPNMDGIVSSRGGRTGASGALSGEFRGSSLGTDGLRIEPRGSGPALA